MDHWQKRNLAAGITAAIGIVLILIVVISNSHKYRFKRYRNADKGFSIKYPFLWSYEENKNGAAVIFSSLRDGNSDFFLENVNVVVQDLSKKPKELKKYTETAIMQMEAVFGESMTVLESEPIHIAGRKGYKFDFLGKTPKDTLHYTSVWVLDGHTAYQITYTSLSAQYSKYRSKVKTMINSFRLE